MSYQQETFDKPEDRDVRWQELRKGTADVVRYSTQVFAGKKDDRGRELSKMEFVVAWPVRT